MLARKREPNSQVSQANDLLYQKLGTSANSKSLQWASPGIPWKVHTGRSRLQKKNTLENIEEENFVSVWSMTTLLIRAPNRSQNVERKETF